MRRDLLWANSLEEVLEEVVVRHEDRAVFGVVRMHISDLHVGSASLVVIIVPVFLSVLRFRTATVIKRATYILVGTLAVAAILEA